MAAGPVHDLRTHLAGGGMRIPRRRAWVWDVLGALIAALGILLWYALFSLVLPWP